MDKILSNIGLCNRARGLVVGTDIVLDNVRAGKVKLVFLATDTSLNTQKKVQDKCNYYGVEVIKSYSSEELSLAIGKENKMVIGITNESFLKILKKYGDYCGEKTG